MSKWNATRSISKHSTALTCLKYGKVEKDYEFAVGRKLPRTLTRSHRIGQASRVVVMAIAIRWLVLVNVQINSIARLCVCRTLVHLLYGSCPIYSICLAPVRSWLPSKINSRCEPPSSTAAVFVSASRFRFQRKKRKTSRRVHSALVVKWSRMTVVE